MTSLVSTLVLAVFILTYLGMALGRLPGLAIDRTGITLSGLIVLLVIDALQPGRLGAALELPSLLLLFALMLVAAHVELTGAFDWLIHQLLKLNASPRLLLALTIASAGVLSAVLVNDIVVFAFTPMLCRGVRQRGLDPRPFLLALAGAANAGSAATLIGNPQNILIGQVGHLGFWPYMRIAWLPAVATLGIIYTTVAWTWRDALAAPTRPPPATTPSLDIGPACKGLLSIAILIILLATLKQRVIAALAIAGSLLWSRRLSTRSLLAQVDGALLVMIGCLFAITAAATQLPAAQHGIAWLNTHHLMPVNPGPLALFSLLAGNAIGNVPAVVLLLKAAPHITTQTLQSLALLATLAGNLLITGSLANIIVAERGLQYGATIRFIDFARVGIPITALSMTIAAGWLWVVVPHFT